MSRSYPIWNKVAACIYQSDKSYGAKKASEATVLVGSSNKNSYELVTHQTTRHETEDMVIYSFWLDGVKVKKAEFSKDKKGKLTHLSTYYVRSFGDKIEKPVQENDQNK
jgi:hypothetical protein